MHWAQTILFCGGLIYAAVDDLKTRTVSNIVCIVIALAGLITISPASLLGTLLAMLPFYLCAGFGLMGGGHKKESREYPFNSQHKTHRCS